MNLGRTILITLCLLTMVVSAYVPVVIPVEAAAPDNAPTFSQTYAEGMREASILVEETAKEIEESGWGQVGYEIMRPH